MGAVLAVYVMTYRVGLPLSAKLMMAAAVMTVLWIKTAPLWSWQAVARLWSAPK
jgi:hypothetical protein